MQTDAGSSRGRIARFGAGLARALVQPTTGSTGYWSRLAAMMAPGGWIYRDAHYLVIDVELDPALARRFVPWPLRLASPARGQIFSAYFPHTTFGSVYREAGIFFEVVSPLGIHAVYSPWMLVDDDVALIMGRELLGYPKKLGEFTWELAGNSISATTRRRGADLLSMHGTLGENMASPPPILGRPHRNVRASAGLALPKVHRVHAARARDRGAPRERRGSHRGLRARSAPRARARARARGATSPRRSRRLAAATTDGPRLAALAGSPAPVEDSLR